MRRFVIGVLLGLAVVAAVTAARAADDALWLREPALSPDGSRVAFRFDGQIWIAPAAGGDAVALTPAGFHAAAPHWSPDGTLIAFAADRFGPMNIFVVPARGGEARRLTWFRYDERPSSFTPDGKAVLFSSSRLGDATQTFAIPNRFEEGAQLYAVPVEGGRDTMVLPNAAFDARWDADGRRLLYTGASIEQPFRKGQTSSAARQVWLYDAGSGRHARLTDDVHESRDAVWAPDGDVYYLSEASGSLNVWRLKRADVLATRGQPESAGAEPEQVTHLSGDPVRSLSMARNGDLAFSWGGALYRLRAGAREPERIAIDILHVSFPGEHAGRSTGFSDFAVSPNGRDFALVSRGGLYVASVDGKYVKRLPHGAGEERSPNFSADGRRIAYAAERDGRWSLYESSLADPADKSFSEATRIDERLLKGGDEDAMLPVYAPDGHHVAYVANRASVRVLDVASKSDVEILPAGRTFSHGDWSWWLSWSPDSKWVALPMQPSGSLDNVALAPADGSRPAFRPLPSGEDQEDASFSPDGGVLMWRTNADALHSMLGAGWRVDVEAAFTSRRSRDAYERTLRLPVGADGAVALEDARPGPVADATRAGRPGVHDPLGLEPDGIDQRTLRFTEAPAELVFCALLADGVSLLSVEQAPNPRGDGLTVTGTVRDLRQERRRILFSGLPYQRFSPVRISRDQKHLYFLSRGTGAEASLDGLMEIDVARGSARVIKVAADTTRDEAEARRAAFEQFWTLTRKKFYDPSLHGVDWDAARVKYERFLPSIADAKDLAELLSEMAGDLDASHTGSQFGGSVPPAEMTASLGLYYDERYPGPGMKVAEILPGGPFDTGDSELAPGDILQAVDGEPVPLEGGIRRLLRGRVNELVAITATHPDGRSFTEKHNPVSIETESGLAARRWVRRKRDHVAALSCGRIGYVYVPAMDAPSYRSVFAEIFGRFGDADGLVVDIRYNGGGELHNQLLTLLSGRTYMTFVPPRGGPVQDEPRDRWTKPSAVVMNAVSYSDASVFPQAYRDLKLGPLVGDPVAGTGTYVWWVQSAIIPGLTYGLPQLPLRKMDGQLIENHDILPDIEVLSDPTDWARGEDPQLDAAVRALRPDRGAPCPAKEISVP